tara:strand:+ start:70 stop:306 length:237 start_codon:yes stop_codon:yes gene_type:complete
MNEREIVRRLQEEKYGAIDSPYPENTVRIKVMGFRESLDMDLQEFKKNPSYKNFEELKMSMYWYQYWSLKAVYDEVEG